MATTSYAHLFGTTAKPRGKQGFPGVGGSGAPPTLTQPSQPNQAQMMAPAMQTPTFAQMQSSGQARPAPPAAPVQPYAQAEPVGMTPYGGQTADISWTEKVNNAINQNIAKRNATPAAGTAPGGDILTSMAGQYGTGGGAPSGSRYDTELFRQLREFGQQQLESEFAAQRQRLEEDMARRGLASSSISSGRYGDLAGQQARAMTDLDLSLMREAATTQMNDRLARDRFLVSLIQAISGGDQSMIDDLLAGLGGGA